MEIAFLIIGAILISTIINASIDGVRKHKKIGVNPFDVKIDYPTKEEYEEKVKEIQSKELESDKFKSISNLMKEHYLRGNIRLEEKLFEIISDDNLFGKSFDFKKQVRTTKFKKLNEFINSLTQEQIESNLYLKAAFNFLESSAVDCKKIVELLCEEIDFDEISRIPKKISVDIDIPETTCDILSLRVSEQIGIKYYNPEAYKISYVNVLDEENSHTYTEYNRYASKVDKLAEEIYLLQMWNLLSVFPYEIDNDYFHFLHNSFEHRILVSCFVRQDELVKSDMYKVSDKTKKMISRIVGLPYDDVIKMSLDELDGYLEAKYGKKLNRNLAWTSELKKEEKRISFEIKK